MTLTFSVWKTDPGKVRFSHITISELIQNHFRTSKIIYPSGWSTDSSYWPEKLMSACFCLIKSSASLWIAFTSSGVLGPMRPFVIFPDHQANVGAFVCVLRHFLLRCWVSAAFIMSGVLFYYLSYSNGTRKWIPHPLRCRRPGSKHMGNLHRLSAGTVNTMYQVSPGVEAGERGNVCVRIEITDLPNVLLCGAFAGNKALGTWALLFGQLEGLNVTFVQDVWESMIQSTWQLVDKTRLAFKV